MEKRYDVRVPLINTPLLEQLAAESEKTGIVESRLIVLYATKYVEYSRNALVPLITAPVSTQPAANRHSEIHESAAQGTIQASLGSEALDTMFGDPD